MDSDNLRQWWQGAVIFLGLLSSAAAFVSFHYSEKAKREQDARFNGKLDKIQSSLNPFLALAKQTFPGKSDEDALKALHAQFNKLDIRTTTLENRTRPREITDEQLERLRQVIKGLSPLAVSIGFPADSEAIALATKLKDLFESMHWQVNFVGTRMVVIGTTKAGITMYFSRGNRAIGLPIAQGLHDVGLSVEANEAPEEPGIQIFVGPKR